MPSPSSSSSPVLRSITNGLATRIRPKAFFYKGLAHAKVAWLSSVRLYSVRFGPKNKNPAKYSLSRALRQTEANEVARLMQRAPLSLFIPPIFVLVRVGLFTQGARFGCLLGARKQLSRSQGPRRPNHRRRFAANGCCSCATTAAAAAVVLRWGASSPSARASLPVAYSLAPPEQCLLDAESLEAPILRLLRAPTPPLRRPFRQFQLRASWPSEMQTHDIVRSVKRPGARASGLCSLGCGGGLVGVLSASFRHRRRAALEGRPTHQWLAAAAAGGGAAQNWPALGGRRAGAIAGHYRADATGI